MESETETEHRVDRHCAAAPWPAKKPAVFRSSSGGRKRRTSAAAWQIRMRSSASQDDEVISVSSEDHDEDQKPPAKKFIKENCTICYEALGFEHDELDGCEHAFHPKCLNKYFRKMNTTTCPLCRGLDPAAFGEEEEDDDGMVRRTGVSDEEIGHQQQLLRGAGVNIQEVENGMLHPPVAPSPEVDDEATAAAQDRFHALLAQIPEAVVPAARAAPAISPTTSSVAIDLTSPTDDEEEDDDDVPSLSHVNVTCDNEECKWRLTRGRKWRSHVRDSSLPKDCEKCKSRCRVNKRRRHR